MVQNKAAIEGLAEISDILLRCRVTEKLYMSSNLSHTANSRLDVLNMRKSFEKKIVTLYTQVLEYQVGMASSLGSSLNRWLYNWDVTYNWQGMKDQILSLEKSIREDGKMLDQTRLLAGFEEQAQVMQKVSQDAKQYFEILLSAMKNIEQTISMWQELGKHVKDSREIMAVLSSGYSNLMDITVDKVQGTCAWFLNHTEFQKWERAREPSMVLLTGSPGCGKSVLMRSVSQNRVKPTRQIQREQISCYYFFRSSGKIGESGRVSGFYQATDAISALLHQVLVQKPELMSKFIRPWEQHQIKLATNFSALWQLLEDCATESSIECIIDAIDECGNASMFELIGKLKDHYELARQGPHGLYFILSGRPYFNREYHFQDLVRSEDRCFHIDMDEVDLGAEMSLVITSEVKQLNLPEPAMRKHLERRLSEFQTNTRTYLWLRLLFAGLKYDLGLGTMNESEIDEVVKTLPRDLDSAYDAILERSSDAGTTRLLLQIILGASRPFTTQELQIAYYLAKDGHKVNYKRLIRQSNTLFQRTVASLCGAFITFVRERAYIFHLTASEFLRTPIPSRPAPSKLKWAYTFQPRASHHVLFRLCILRLWDPQVLETAIFPSGNTVMDMSTRDTARLQCNGIPLLRYASRRWREHFYLAQGGFTPEKLAITEEETSMIIELSDLSSDHFWSWYLCSWSFAPTEKSMRSMSERDQWEKAIEFPSFDYWMLTGHGSNEVFDKNLRPIAKAWRIRTDPAIVDTISSSQRRPYTATKDLGKLWDFITEKGQDHLCTELLHASFSQKDADREETLEMFSRLPNGSPYACVLLACDTWKDTTKRNTMLVALVHEWLMEQGYMEQISLDADGFVMALSASGLLADPGPDTIITIRMEELLMLYAAFTKKKALVKWLVHNNPRTSLRIHGKTNSLPMNVENSSRPSSRYFQLNRKTRMGRQEKESETTDED